MDFNDEISVESFDWNSTNVGENNTNAINSGSSSQSQQSSEPPLAPENASSDSHFAVPQPIRLRPGPKSYKRRRLQELGIALSQDLEMENDSLPPDNITYRNRNTNKRPRLAQNLGSSGPIIGSEEIAGSQQPTSYPNEMVQVSSGPIISSEEIVGSQPATNPDAIAQNFENFQVSSSSSEEEIEPLIQINQRSAVVDNPPQSSPENSRNPSPVPSPVQRIMDQPVIVPARRSPRASFERLPVLSPPQIHPSPAVTAPIAQPPNRNRRVRIVTNDSDSDSEEPLVGNDRIAGAPLRQCKYKSFSFKTPFIIFSITFSRCAAKQRRRNATKTHKWGLNYCLSHVLN